jgi:hypothetical protein
MVVLKMESWDSFVDYLLYMFWTCEYPIDARVFSSVPSLFDCSEKKEEGKTGIVES